MGSNPKMDQNNNRNTGNSTLKNSNTNRIKSKQPKTKLEFSTMYQSARKNTEKDSEYLIQVDDNVFRRAVTNVIKTWSNQIITNLCKFVFRRLGIIRVDSVVDFDFVCGF